MKAPPSIRDIVTGRPARVLRLSFVTASLSVWLSGAAWLLAHYFLVSSGPFGPQPSAWEPRLLAVHGAAAFASVWVLGWISGTHVPVVWRLRTRLASGVSMIAFAAILVLSGYLLYYVNGDDTRRIISLLHWIVGLGALPAFLLHRGRGERPVQPN